MAPWKPAAVLLELAIFREEETLQCMHVLGNGDRCGNPINQFTKHELKLHLDELSEMSSWDCLHKQELDQLAGLLLCYVHHNKFGKAMERATKTLNTRLSRYCQQKERAKAATLTKALVAMTSVCLFILVGAGTVILPGLLRPKVTCNQEKSGWW